MGIGNKIKELRLKNNLTQKELADKLFVTYQAVSSWENDEVEPSIETIKIMAELFNCSIDEIFGKEDTNIKEEPKVIEKIVYQEQKPVLAVCEKCNKPIYDPMEIKRFTITLHHYQGRSHSTEHINKVYCESCNNKRLEEERREKERKENERKDKIRKHRITSYIVGGVLALSFISIGIYSLVSGDNEGGITAFVLAVIVFEFASCMILNNTFIPDLWIDVASWGFVKMPGIIFDLSLDGIIWLLTIKLALWILGFILAIAAALFATLLAAVLSVFVYPFSLARSYRYAEEN